jgi:hypothetical protein
MITEIHLRTQAEIRTNVKNRLRDSTSERWKTTPVDEVYMAMNEAIVNWGPRVRTPFVYTITNGLIPGTWDYSIPSYVVQPMDLQQRYWPGMQDWGINVSSVSEMWIDVPAWELSPDGDGTQTLHLGAYPYAEDARIVYWPMQSQVPVATSTTILSSSISSSSATTLTLDVAVDVADNGYVKIDYEWMKYSGVTRESDETMTLTNLVRGFYNTTATTHSSNAVVYWGIAVHDPALYQQLLYQTLATLHSLFVTAPSPTDTEHYMNQARMYMQLANEQWRNITPMRQPKQRLSRGALAL